MREETTVVALGDGQTWKFLQPVQAAAPPCHQIDTDHEGSGWSVREKYLDEELDSPPADWAIDVPERLAFESDYEAPDTAHDGFYAFVQRCCVVDEDVRVEKDVLLDGYDGFARSKGYEPAGSKKQLISWAKSVLGDDIESGDSVKIKHHNGDWKHAYGGLALDRTGASYADIQPNNPSVVGYDGGED